MKIVVASHHALPHVGGLEVVVDRELRLLIAAGHEIVHITSDALGEAQPPVSSPSIRVIRVPAWHVLEKYTRLSYPIFSARLLFALWREIGAADLVHAHGFIFMNSAIALLVARLRGKPAILTDHGGFQQYRTTFLSTVARLAMETIGRSSARLATRLKAHNTRVLVDLEKLAGTDEKSIFLPVPIDRTFFRPLGAEAREQVRQSLGWKTDEKIVFFAGRLIPEKGVPLLLNLKRQGWKLVLCGPAGPEMIADVKKAGADYLPPRPQRDLAMLYQAADVTAAPSEVNEGGFPMVVQESLCCGTPAIMSYDYGYAPYRNLVGLYFMERSNADSLLQAINTVLQAPRYSEESFSQSARNLFPDDAEWVSRFLGWLGATKDVETNKLNASS